jgi:hypothetical protein
MAGTALAHESNPRFSSVVRGVSPPAPGLEVRVLDGDDRLQIRDPDRRTIVVLGYGGEPYARLLPSGAVQVNVRSPAAYLNEDRYAEVDIPADADPRAAPVWKAHTSAGLLEWHDHRAHWMGRGPPPQVADTDVRAKVFDYRVPITVDGRPSAIEGTLYWVGRDGGGTALWVWAALEIGAIALLATVVVVAVRRRRRRRGPGAPPGEAW